jgi:hypothetical protein
VSPSGPSLSRNTVSCSGLFRATSAVCLVALFFAALGSPQSQSPSSVKTTEWKSVQFAIVRFNEEAPQTWNIYHTSKRGILLVKLWKRYLLVNVGEQQVFDIDPDTVKPSATGVNWSTSDMPKDPLEITDWKDRNVGPVERVRFRLSKNGHFLELQLPIGPDGKPVY